MSTADTPTRNAAGRVWLITGASSGFGRAIAEAALATGDTVVATARRRSMVSPPRTPIAWSPSPWT
jgi:NADP-dependent 3-hydroxy acid dehydrogenase YdfG